MSRLCPACGKPAEQTEQTSCQGCGAQLVAQAATVASALCPEPPAASIMPADDDALLQRENVRAPSRLGSMGRVGKFEIIKLLGRGGMAEVYLATEPVTGTNVALKMLREELSGDERIRRLFLAEARHMYGLSHPGIMRVLEVSAPEAGASFVMPYARGGSLDTKLGTEPLPLDATVCMATQIAEGLAYAHGKGLLHRDLKPANILLDEDGRAMIADFGLVRPFHGDGSGAAQTGLEGTPAYMSPAVASGRAEDTRADIYAFGALLYEMLSGKPPYSGQEPMQVLEQVVAGPPPPLATATRLSSPGLVAIADACMARELRDRYATMDDVVADLKLVAANKPPRGPHGGGAAGGRRMWVLAGMALAVLVAAASAVLPALKGALGNTSGSRELLARADELRKSGKWEEAADAYALILERDPADSRARFGLGLAEIERGRTPRGTQLLRRAHDEAPGDAEIAQALVDNLIDIGHYVPAMVAVETWLQADPESKKALEWKEKLEDLLATSPHTFGPREDVRPPQPPDGAPRMGPPGRRPPLEDDRRPPREDPRQRPRP